jgi:hypothetical protein
MLDLSPVSLIASTAFIAAVYVFHKLRSANQYQGCKLPPGPRGWPIIGSLLDLPNGEAPWAVYREWAHKYGQCLRLGIFQYYC